VAALKGLGPELRLADKSALQPARFGNTVCTIERFNDSMMQRAMPSELKPSYSPGLEGVLAGETSICWVDPDAGLLYRGYDIHQLAARVSFEEIVWLLLHGELPTPEQLAELTRQLVAERSLPSQVEATLCQFPRGTHPMDMLRTGVSMLAAFDPDLNDHSHQANLRKAVRLVAKVSPLIADGWRIAHAQAPVPARADLSHAANFLYCLTGQAPEPWRTEIIFRARRRRIFSATGRGDSAKK